MLPRCSDAIIQEKEGDRPLCGWGVALRPHMVQVGLPYIATLASIWLNFGASILRN